MTNAATGPLSQVTQRCTAPRGTNTAQPALVQGCPGRR